MACFWVFYFGKISLRTMVVVIKLVHSTSIMCIQYGSSTDLGDAYIHVHAHTTISHSFEYNLRDYLRPSVPFPKSIPWPAL